MDNRYEVKITQHAEESMREIAGYIAYDLLEPETAVKLLLTLQTEINSLAYMPGRIPLTPEEPWHSQGVRRMRIHNFYVYFWSDEDKCKVQVTDVVYVGRDQERQLAIMPMD